MKMAQEGNIMEEYKQYAKDLSDLKKLIKSEDYVHIDIGYYEDEDSDIRKKWINLYKYDLPRWLYDEKKWVIRWRVAKEQCKYPLKDVNSYTSFYEKKTGFDEHKKEVLQKITNHFTQIRKQERILAEWKEHCKTLLFVDEKELALEKKINQKLATRKAELEKLIEEYKQF